MNIYVRNLSPVTSLPELRGCFEVFGEVIDATICTYQSKGISRCLGYIEMPSKVHGDAAIIGMQGKELNGTLLKVQEN